MSYEKIFKGQQFTITLETGVDLSSKTDSDVKILVKKPDETEETLDATISSPATDGLISHTFEATTGLDQVGEWQLKSLLVSENAPGAVYTISVLERFTQSAYPTAQEIREYLEGYCLPESKISNTYIARRRDMVMRWLETRTRLPMLETLQFEEYCSGTGSTLLILSRKPIVSLDSIEYVSSPYNASPSLSSVELIKEEGLLKAKENFEEGRYPVFPKGSYNIKITYTAGNAEIPDDLYEAIMAFTCEKILAFMEGRTGGGDSLSNNGYSRSYGSRGKYTNVRNELARWGHSLAAKYFTGVVAS